MAFRFFITRPQESTKKSPPERIYGIDANGLPYVEPPDVVLFGVTRQSYYESLAAVVYAREGVRLRVPRDYAHPGFQGEEVTLPYSEFIKQIERMIGPFNDFPERGVAPMDVLFEKIKEMAALKKKK